MRILCLSLHVNCMSDFCKLGLVVISFHQQLIKFTIDDSIMEQENCAKNSETKRAIMY